MLLVTAPGTYSLASDNASSQCSDFSCCPFIVEEDTLPSFQVSAIPVTCVGNTMQTNGRLVVTGADPAYTYQYSAGASFDPAAALSGAAQPLPANGVLADNLANPAKAQAYTVRIFNNSGCYKDMSVLLVPTVCGCPTEVCVPFVLQQTKRAQRIGDAR